MPCLMLEGMRLVVTGSSRGIGAAIAKAAAKAGALVVVNYRVNHAAAAQTAAAIEDIRSGSCIVCQADVREPEQADRLIRTCVDKWQGLDGLVNNAHTEFRPTRFEELSWSNVTEQIDGSLKSVFNCTLAALPHLCESVQGVVLNISTMIVTDPSANMSARIAAKGAVEAMTRSLAYEYGGPKRAVRFNALSVGWTETDQLRNVPYDVQRVVTANIPMGRMAMPSEIAETAVFLLSRRASYITGSVFPVAGGHSPDPR
jgi:3-oxoacyl-[acyl-carrier protein] reductase